jgi:hypothetical protein
LTHVFIGLEGLGEQAVYFLMVVRKGGGERDRDTGMGPRERERQRETERERQRQRQRQTQGWAPRTKNVFRDMPLIIYFLTRPHLLISTTTPHYAVTLSICQWINPLMKIEPSSFNHFPKAPGVNTAAFRTKPSNVVGWCREFLPSQAKELCHEAAD